MRGIGLENPNQSDMDKLRNMAIDRGGEAQLKLVETVIEQHEDIARRAVEALRINSQTFTVIGFNSVWLTHNKPSNNSPAFFEVELHLDLKDSLDRTFSSTIRVNPDLTTDVTGLYLTEVEARTRV